jgi:hypothetical protein
MTLKQRLLLAIGEAETGRRVVEACSDGTGFLGHSKASWIEAIARLNRERQRRTPQRLWLVASSK